MFSHPKYHVGEMVQLLDKRHEQEYTIDARRNSILDNESVGIIIDIYFFWSEDGKPQYFVRWLDKNNWQTFEMEKDLNRVEQKNI